MAQGPEFQKLGITNKREEQRSPCWTLPARAKLGIRLGLRDRMMLFFFYDTGDRIQEVLNVHICDLKLDSTPKVVLHGKGNKVRTVPLMKDTAQYLKHYMAVFHEGESAASTQFLFYTERKSVRKPVCDDTVRLMMPIAD